MTVSRQTWHVVFTRPRCEADAVEEIADMGFSAYSPMERCKRWRHGWHIYERAYFQRYLFARFDLGQNWNEIRYADGVIDILCNNNIPQRCPDGLVEELQHQQQLGLFDRTRRPMPFPPGTVVKLDNKGPFAEFIGRVMRCRTGDRVDLLIALMGKTINVPLMRLSTA